MGRFPPPLRALPFDSLQLLHRLLQISKSTGGLRLLESRVSGRTLANTLTAQPDQCAPCACMMAEALEGCATA